MPVIEVVTLLGSYDNARVHDPDSTNSKLAIVQCYYDNSDIRDRQSWATKVAAQLERKKWLRLNLNAISGNWWADCSLAFGGHCYL